MNHSLVIKTITLCGFFSLITLFVLYRTGKFESPFFSENILAENDTIPRKKDSILSFDYKSKTFSEIKWKIDSIESQQKKTLLLSSSKSGAVFTQEQSKLRNENKADTTHKNEVVVMGYSTKSARVFYKNDLERRQDSIKWKRKYDSLLARYKYLLDSIEKEKSE